ncbi:hypothetical protein [Paenibacillus taichungensis]|uniref:hypothetical protein n=1 Tax=Paenibacillus taichungensis TaxID=484184 RepID=UPI002870FBDF|nr:hypothetical protein [Paenibacillus taichungensis]MDR9743763.1 hypothetical protein [Paenibacillus taichungensis]
MSDMNHNNKEQTDFNAISGEEKLQALRDLIELTDNHLTQQVLNIGMDPHEEDLIRIEAWRALGMAGSSALLGEILHVAAQLVRNPEEDEDVQIYVLQTLALLPITETEIKLAQEVLEGDAYILLKEAAFAILVAHQHVSGAKSALESLQINTNFTKTESKPGEAATKSVRTNRGTENLNSQTPYVSISG